MLNHIIGFAADAGTTLNVVLETGHIDAVMQAVLGGFGVTVLNMHYVADEIAAGRLCELQVEGFPLRLEWFVVHPDSSLTPSARVLKDHLLQSKSLFQSKSGLSVPDVN